MCTIRRNRFAQLDRSRGALVAGPLSSSLCRRDWCWLATLRALVEARDIARSVCGGKHADGRCTRVRALTVAEAGLLKGHRATGHWASYAKRKREYPDTEWLENTRYVAESAARSRRGKGQDAAASAAAFRGSAPLDRALADIAGMYGRRTARFVALQMEYPQ